MMKWRNVLAEKMRGNHSRVMADIAAGPSADTKEAYTAVKQLFRSVYGKADPGNFHRWIGILRRLRALDHRPPLHALDGIISVITYTMHGLFSAMYNLDDLTVNRGMRTTGTPTSNYQVVSESQDQYPYHYLV